jgi:hypothetical protein
MMLPSVNPKLYALLERAALREEAARRDWQRHFAHRMSYDEYNLIGALNTEVRGGRMCGDRAQDCLAIYRANHTNTPQP